MNIHLYLLKSTRKPFLYTFVVTLGLLAATGALAWTGPSASAPSSNASAPLNVSNAGQIKVGGLQLNTGGAATGLIVGGNAVLNGGISDTAGSRMDAGGGWLRTYNATGWYNGTYNGGWNMSDSSWIRSYGPANVYISTGFDTGGAAAVSCGGTLAGGYNFRVCGTQNVTGGLTVAGAGTFSSGIDVSNGGGAYTFIALHDDEDTTGNHTKYIHANSNVIGFLRGDQTAWMAYWSPTGMQNAGTINSIGAVTAPAFYYSSDARLKKNVEAIASSKALQDILALQPVTYNWIDPTAATTTQIGFIAQQVESIVPELVTTDASTTLKAVDYARVAPLLVGAVQAQQAQIDELKAEVAALRAGE